MPHTRGESVSKQQNNQPQPTCISDLRPKMKLEGTIRRVELYGAFVDIGLERDGLIHISQLSNRRVDRVSDVVKEGDRVTVWVARVDPEQGRIGLTMVEPPKVEWRELKEGQSYTGRIVRMERYGVFVDIGAGRPGLLHVREMGGRVFRHPSELFREGDEVEVRILSLDRRKKRIDLTMQDLVDTVIEDEEHEDLPTAIELAFRRAQEEARHQKRETSSRKRRKRGEQEDILARTLEQHSG
ncbi:MAG TPA: S1 RNA-binding domain-containing protein [Anaerolineales bacterium]|nr:S1 RNA-binding domain-containing protein [Anaerolineae bacterium]HIQ01040.1 S1 RNA-binding domain-containing protein [Anaerolineales bacterium]